MSFRRDTTPTDEEREFQLWLRQQRELAAQTGLPANVLANWDDFQWFLMEGTLRERDNSLWELDDLSTRQKATLLRLLFTRPPLMNSVVASRLILALIKAVEERYK